MLILSDDITKFAYVHRVASNIKVIFYSCCTIYVHHVQLVLSFFALFLCMNDVFSFQEVNEISSVLQTCIFELLINYTNIKITTGKGIILVK